MIARGIVAAALLATSAAAAEAPAGMHVDVFSPVFAGYTAGILCNREIQPDIAAEFVRSKLGNATFNIDQVAYLAFFQVGQQELQATLGALPKNQRDKLSYCAKMMGNFGPNGTSIPGLLK